MDYRLVIALGLAAVVALFVVARPKAGQRTKPGTKIGLATVGGLLLAVVVAGGGIALVLR